MYSAYRRTIDILFSSGHICKERLIYREQREEEGVKVSKIRQVITAPLKASQNTAAIVTTFNEIDMKNVMDLKAKYKDAFENKSNKTAFHVVFNK